MIPAFQWDLGPRSPWGRFRRTLDGLNAIIYQEIASARAETNNERQDCLQLLVSAVDGEGAPLADEALRDLLMGLIAGAIDTSFGTTLWMLHWLLLSPTLMQKVQEEASIEATPWTDAALRETLRISPPDGGLFRCVVQPVEIDGWRLPVGMLAGVAPYLSHLDPDIFDEPETFWPQRFIETPRPDRNHYYPFWDG